MLEEKEGKHFENTTIDYSSDSAEELEWDDSELVGFLEEDGVDLKHTDDTNTFKEALESGKDVYFARTTIDTSATTMDSYCRHIMSLILKTQRRILRNNSKKSALLSERPLLEPSEEDKFRDHGFTRPLVLVLTPFRNQTYDIVRKISQLWNKSGTGKQVEGMRRFQEEYGPEPDEPAAEEHSKGAVFGWQFRGNVDDCFRIGIKFTRKSMRLFSDFYAADLILASPLGLRMVLEGVLPGENGKPSRKRKKPDQDFLSSIRFCLIDQGELMSMQNWEHLCLSLNCLNLMPKESHDCDFSRLMHEYMNGKAAELRQTVLLSEYQFPELNALRKKYCKEDVVILEQVPSDAVFKEVRKSPKIAFLTFSAKSLLDLPDARFRAFEEKIFPTLLKQKTGICIFIPSYFDFCRLRSFLQEKQLDLVALSEYTSTPDISRARSKFFNGHTRMLLVTERFHFFRRYRIRGIKTLVFYGIPANVSYVKDWVDEQKEVRMLVEPSYDRLALERFIGTERADRLLNCNQ